MNSPTVADLLSRDPNVNVGEDKHTDSDYVGNRSASAITGGEAAAGVPSITEAPWA